MATQLFLLNTTAVPHLGTNSTTLAGANPRWRSLALGMARGSGVQSVSSATAAGPTSGLEVRWDTTEVQEWISPPVSADVTISGTITCNIWAAEGAMTSNVAINVVVDVLRANTTTTRDSNTIVQIVKTARTTEVAITTRAANNFTATPTSTVVNRGDRLRVRVFADDSSDGNMGSGSTFSVSWNGSSASADGDTYVTFTETFGFESAPAGSTLYLTDTASDVATASVDREAWTSRGSGVQTDVTNTAAGWTAPIQVTDTAGGTVVDWFTKRLNAFTLGGMAVANIRAAATASASSSLRVEIARVENDGTSATVWGTWCINAAGNVGLVGTSEAAYTADVSGDDLAVTDGQRLRLRIYLDDSAVMAASQTVTTYYAGTSGGASGDSYITLPQTVTEYTPPATGGPALRRHRRASRFLTVR